MFPGHYPAFDGKNLYFRGEPPFADEASLLYFINKLCLLHQ
jgi:hypothetical protein